MNYYDFAWGIRQLSLYVRCPVYLADGRIVGYYLDGRWQVRAWHEDLMAFVSEPLVFETDSAVDMAAWLNNAGALPERPNGSTE